MNDRPEILHPTITNNVNDDPTLADKGPVRDDAGVTIADEPLQKPKSRVTGSIRSLVDDFVDYTKKTEF
jgi:hypothetical protein